MFKGREKIYKAVLQTEQNYPKDISYRGQGLSNEHRLLLPSGLTPSYKEGFHKGLSITSKGQIQTIDDGRDMHKQQHNLSKKNSKHPIHR